MAHESNRARALSFGMVIGACIGAAAVYFLESGGGAGRRARLRDQSRALARRWGRIALGRSDHLRNRITGAGIELAKAVSGEEGIPDEVLVYRVRSEMGRVVSHPRTITVLARDGEIVLQGPVLADDVSKLLECVESVSGVRKVHNQLDVHQTPDIAALQG